MSKSREKKSEELKILTETLTRMKSGVFTTSKGLDVAAQSALRKSLREGGVQYSVVKKTLLRKALEEAKIEAPIDAYFDGLALSASFDDEVAPAKLLATFAKTHETLVLEGGIVNGTVYSGTDIKALAALPSKQELLAKIVGSLARPLTAFLQVVNGPTRGFVQVLRAKAEQ